MCVSAKDHQRAGEGSGQTSVRPKPRHREALRSQRALLTGAVSGVGCSEAGCASEGVWGVSMRHFLVASVRVAQSC